MNSTVFNSAEDFRKDWFQRHTPVSPVPWENVPEQTRADWTVQWLKWEDQQRVTSSGDMTVPVPSGTVQQLNRDGKG